jgi:hypothetical protein
VTPVVTVQVTATVTVTAELRATAAQVTMTVIMQVLCRKSESNSMEMGTCLSAKWQASSIALRLCPPHISTTHTISP